VESGAARSVTLTPDQMERAVSVSSGPARCRELSGADAVLAAMLALYVSTSAKSSPAHFV
jgi:hypothetical protein